MKKYIVLLIVLLSGCSSVVEPPSGGYIVPNRCVDNWLCYDDPLCKVELYKPICDAPPPFVYEPRPPIGSPVNIMEFIDRNRGTC